MRLRRQQHLPPRHRSAQRRRSRRSPRRHRARPHHRSHHRSRHRSRRRSRLRSRRRSRPCLQRLPPQRRARERHQERRARRPLRTPNTKQADSNRLDSDALAIRSARTTTAPTALQRERGPRRRRPPRTTELEAGRRSRLRLRSRSQARRTRRSRLRRARRATRRANDNERAATRVPQRRTLDCCACRESLRSERRVAPAFLRAKSAFRRSSASLAAHERPSTEMCSRGSDHARSTASGGALDVNNSCKITVQRHSQRTERPQTVARPLQETVSQRSTHWLGDSQS